MTKHYLNSCTQYYIQNYWLPSLHAHYQLEQRVQSQLMAIYNVGEQYNGVAACTYNWVNQ